jgi:putative methionine-R-sulfoxide reductase with GAF domain
MSLKKMNNELITMAKGLIDENLPLVSNLSNLSSLIKDNIKGTSWAGFYLSNEMHDELFLGPFQGSVACTLIPFNKGVCGKAAYTKVTQLVPDVNKFKGHIACSSSSRSEIVVPIIKNNECYGVIDLDSDDYDNFNEEDAKTLEAIADLVSILF